MKIEMKNVASVIIQKVSYGSNKQIRTLVLSTNVNDYDTGEPVIGGSIRNTLTNSNSGHRVDNLNGIKVGRKYFSHLKTPLFQMTV